jgi:hypothetical protein
MRTNEEILARIEELKPHDFFGFQTQDLVGALDYEQAKPFLKDGVTAAEWDRDKMPRDREAVLAFIRDYLPFAVEKATNHRGLSANRSIYHLRAWVWLLGDEDYRAIDWEKFRNYGAPVILQVAKRFEVMIPIGPDLIAMAEGRPCKPGCQSGCGR